MSGILEKYKGVKGKDHKCLQIQTGFVPLVGRENRRDVG